MNKLINWNTGSFIQLKIINYQIVRDRNIVNMWRIFGKKEPKINKKIYKMLI